MINAAFTSPRLMFLVLRIILYKNFIKIDVYLSIFLRKLKRELLPLT